MFMGKFEQIPFEEFTKQKWSVIFFTDAADEWLHSGHIPTQFLFNFFVMKKGGNVFLKA